jgi:hypothetical protein
MQEWSIYFRKGLTFIPTYKFYHMRGYIYRGTPALCAQTSCWGPCSEAELVKSKNDRRSN